jgi:hypothetical protein
MESCRRELGLPIDTHRRNLRKKDKDHLHKLDNIAKPE